MKKACRKSDRKLSGTLFASDFDSFLFRIDAK